MEPASSLVGSLVKRTPLRRYKALRAKRRRTEIASLIALGVRSHGLCELPDCTNRAEHPHHRRLRSQGGTDDLGNLMAVCSRCHRAIHDNRAWALANGYIIDAEAARLRGWK